MKLVITGPSGKMGRLIVREARRRPEDFTLVGAVGNPARPYIGKDISAAAGGEPVGALTYGSIESIIAECDGVIDVPNPAAAMEVLDSCVRHRKPLLIGTTGFTPEQESAIAAAAEIIPISEAHNTSKAVNLFYELLRIVAGAMGESADVDIIEMHSSRKPDSPSGTAKDMGRAVAEALRLNWEQAARFGRSGSEPRRPGEITYHSIRSGDISSVHTVVFGMEGERIELTHRAYDYTTFAKGALDGILFLRDKAPGLYTSAEILGIPPLAGR